MDYLPLYALALGFINLIAACWIACVESIGKPTGKHENGIKIFGNIM